MSWPLGLAKDIFKLKTVENTKDSVDAEVEIAEAAAKTVIRAVVGRKAGKKEAAEKKMQVKQERWLRE